MIFDFYKNYQEAFNYYIRCAEAVYSTNAADYYGTGTEQQKKIDDSYQSYALHRMQYFKPEENQDEQSLKIVSYCINGAQQYNKSLLRMKTSNGFLSSKLSFIAHKFIKLKTLVIEPSLCLSSILLNKALNSIAAMPKKLWEALPSFKFFKNEKSEVQHCPNISLLCDVARDVAQARTTSLPPVVAATEASNLEQHSAKPGCYFALGMLSNATMPTLQETPLTRKIRAEQQPRSSFGLL